jgi:hypothetical protein
MAGAWSGPRVDMRGTLLKSMTWQSLEQYLGGQEKNTVKSMTWQEPGAVLGWTGEVHC